MTASAVMLYDSYQAERTWRGNRAVCLYYVTGLDRNADPGPALAATGLSMGQDYPHGTLTGAPLISLRLIERPKWDRAWVLAIFDGTAIQWGGNGTRILSDTDDTVFDETITIYDRLLRPTTSGGTAYVTARISSTTRKRAYRRRRTYIFRDGAISDALLDQISRNYGKRYLIGGIQYLLEKASIRSNPNGQSSITLIHFTTGSMPKIEPNTPENPGYWEVPALGPLDQLGYTIAYDVNAVNPYYVKLGTNLYPSGENLNL